SDTRSLRSCRRDFHPWVAHRSFRRYLPPLRPGLPGARSTPPTAPPPALRFRSIQIGELATRPIGERLDCADSLPCCLIATGPPSKRVTPDSSCALPKEDRWRSDGRTCRGRKRMSCQSVPGGTRWAVLFRRDPAFGSQNSPPGRSASGLIAPI